MVNQSPRPKRILVVDDEPTLTFFLKQALQEIQTAYTVDTSKIPNPLDRQPGRAKSQIPRTSLRSQGGQNLQQTRAAYIVDIASSGEDALTKLTYHHYDLLITDLNMPGINGFTLIEIAHSLHPALKVILMTAFGSHEVQNEAKNLAVDGYLTKPFPTAQLRDIAQTILMAAEEQTACSNDFSRSRSPNP